MSPGSPFTFVSLEDTVRIVQTLFSKHNPCIQMHNELASLNISPEVAAFLIKTNHSAPDLSRLKIANVVFETNPAHKPSDLE